MSHASPVRKGSKSPSMHRDPTSTCRRSSGSMHRSVSPDVACSTVGVPPEVMQIAQLSAGQRVRQEWSLKKAQRAAAAASASPPGTGTTSAGESARRRRAAMEEAKHAALVQSIESRQQRYHPAGGPGSTATQPPDATAATTPRQLTGGGASSLWSRTKEQRFSYQYGNFEGSYPQFVPTPSLMFRAPALGSYGKSTSFINVVA